MANESRSPTAGEASLDPRLEALRDDQIDRWRAGDRPSVEQYRAENPDLSWNSDVLLDFVFGEYQIRQQLGESPTLDEYTDRFPELAAAFRLQVEVDILFNSRLERLKKASGAEGSPLPSLFRQEQTLAGVAPPQLFRKPELDGYDILGELGRGGMGVVYKARQHKPNRLVAVKILLTGSYSSAELLARFSQESDAIARLQHANIVQVLDVGESQGIPYLTLEWAEGGSLERRLDGTPRQVESSALLVEKLARAAHHAHLRGIIHRDLKPANVLFTVDGVPKLTDFGLAKMLDSPLDQTLTGHMLGTPCYMAPEQAREGARDVGAAADVYSLGAILYELVTGRPPFRASTPASTIQLALTHEPPAPSKMRPDLPRDVETIILKCLQKDPGRRYSTADELADDIIRFTRGEQIRAQPDSWTVRLIGWATRHPVYAALAGVSALAILILPVILALLWLRTLAALIDSRGEVERLKFRVQIVLRSHANEVQKEKARHDEFSTAMLRLDENLLAGDDLLAQYEVGGPSPAFLATRKRLLEQSARALRDVIQRPGIRYDIGDEVTRKTLAQILRRQATISDRLGQPGDADDACREALRLEQFIVDQSPDDLQKLFEMAQSWITQGERQLESHRGRRALEAFDQAARTLDAVVSHPLVIDWLRRSNTPGFKLHVTAANATHQASLIHDELNQIGEAIAAQQRSVQSLRFAVAFIPEDRADKTGLAKGLVYLGELYARAGRAEQAAKADTEAVSLLKNLLQPGLVIPAVLSGDDWQRFSRLGEIHEWLGAAQSRLGVQDEAASHLLQAISLQQSILDRHTGEAPRAVLVRLRSHLGHWATFTLATHRVADSIAAARRRAALANGEPGETFQAARVLSMAFAQANQTSRYEAEALDEEAVALLRDAVVAGLAVGAPFSDPAFDAIRHRDDFRNLADLKVEQSPRLVPE